MDDLFYETNHSFEVQSMAICLSSPSEGRQLGADTYRVVSLSTREKHTARRQHHIDITEKIHETPDDSFASMYIRILAHHNPILMIEEETMHKPYRES